MAHLARRYSSPHIGTGQKKPKPLQRSFTHRHLSTPGTEKGARTTSFGVPPDALLWNLPCTLDEVAWKRGRLFKKWIPTRIQLKGNVLLVGSSAHALGGDATNVSFAKRARVVNLLGYKPRLCELNVPSPSVAPRPDVDSDSKTEVETEEQPPQCFTLEASSRRTLTFASTRSHEWVRTLKAACHPLALSDFTRVCKLGAGSYGDVWLVWHKHTQRLFALKEISKDISSYLSVDPGESRKEFLERVARKNVRNLWWLIGERSAMQRLSDEKECPFQVHLRGAFQDEDFWFILSDYVPGGDLYVHSANRPGRSFDEHTVRVWAAELVVALEDMHRRSLVHRDVKLENIMLDLGGHVHLGDMGFSTSLLSDAGQRRRLKLFCGTKYYVAPEMISGDCSYDHAIDWWALGICLYELMVGVPPFTAQQLSVLYRQIIGDAVRFPADSQLSGACRDFLQQLLCKEPSRRLGCRTQEKDVHQHSEIRAHPFFNNVNWAEVEVRCSRPRFVPQGRGQPPDTQDAGEIREWELQGRKPGQSEKDWLVQEARFWERTVRRQPELKKKRNRMTTEAFQPPDLWGYDYTSLEVASGVQPT